MKVGIGYNDEASSFTNGQKVAKEAIESGKITRPDVTLAFCGGAVDSGDFYKGLRDVLGNSVEIVGGSAVGLITRNNLSYEGYPAGAAVIETDRMTFHVASARGLDRDERWVGQRIGEQLPDEPDARVLLLFYDSLKVPANQEAPPIINASPPLIEGLESAYRKPLSIIGGGLLGDQKFTSRGSFAVTMSENRKPSVFYSAATWRSIRELCTDAHPTTEFIIP